MSNIEIKYENEQMVVSSLEVAKNFGKRHDKLMSEIERMYGGFTDIGYAQNGGDPLFYKTTYIHQQNKQEYPMFLMNRDGLSLLVMGFTGKEAMNWKIKYIQAFNEMEKKIKETNYIPVTPEEKIDLLLQASSNANKRVQKIEERVNNLEDNRFLNPNEYGYLNTQISARIRQVKEIHNLNCNRKQNSELFRAIGREIKQITGVKCRSQLRYKDFDNVLDFVHTWEPSRATMVVIGQMALEV